ncbi:MAG: hypothetical protein MK116_05045 [Phycisphaerales bacterium]|nr:hypothetical protein [Phycisphaerales bacterium]
MAADASVGGGLGASQGHRFLVSMGFMVLAEFCLLAALWVFQSRGHSAPALDTLIWVWPLSWVTIIALCLLMASWGRLVSQPTTGGVGSRRVAIVMVLRLCISAGLLVAPMVAALYAIVMLVLALVSAGATA